MRHFKIFYILTWYLPEPIA